MVLVKNVFVCAEEYVVFGQQLFQEIQSKALRLDKIKLLSKLEKCKGKEGAKEQEDRVLNGFVHLIHK